MLHIYLKSTVLLLLTSLTTHAWAEERLPITSLTPPIPAATAPVSAPMLTPQVARAAFTTGITAREPDSQLARVSAGQTVYYFTELVGLQGHVITHRWEKDGAFQLGLQFPVGGQRWRVHSSKMMTPNLPGTWTVTVQNDDGTTLRQDTLVVDPIMPVEPTIPTAAPVIPAPATLTPAIPAPAQPLTEIPPEIRKEPIDRPTAVTPTTDSQAIWDKLPR
ncbi:DUF2914 domain-containing protein [Thiothrix fructosivorans]|uniref:DUF2914 domain-containing protein n=1 Tax=Thiothrix fructosivorans TaxID=111770 RepID=A0A8B0SLI9_9GAMM|nr:DUF2914 domain-containing protein [Thiothrix fructosivorans]MBO0613200.1 DUF2914 domain-containing protein [Thiothrix fructosivorans]QTX11360.1 DUF2914 domain-containing protein [Thiothrix fructosivorans]